MTFELGTAGTIKTTSKLSKLKPGLVLSHETKCAGPDNTFSGKAAVEYATEPVALTAEFNGASVVTSAALGFEGFSAGVQATIDTAAIKGKNAENKSAENNGALENPADKDAKKNAVNVLGGIQYEDGNLATTVKVEQGYKFSVSLYHAVSGALQLGAAVVADSTKSDQNTFTVGGQYKFSPSTWGKAKTDIKGDKSYTVSSFIEHRLIDPNVVVGLSHQWNGTSRSTAAFGASFALGEN